MRLTPVTLTSHIVETTEGFSIRVLLSHKLWKTDRAGSDLQGQAICTTATDLIGGYKRGDLLRAPGKKQDASGRSEPWRRRPPQSYLREVTAPA